jgi:hypothetical protein
MKGKRKIEEGRRRDGKRGGRERELEEQTEK